MTDGSFLSPYAGEEAKTVYMDQARVTNQTNWNAQGAPPPTVWQNQQPFANPNQAGNFPTRAQAPSQVLPTVSLVLGILGLFLFCCHLGIPLGAGAVVTGFIAMNQEKSDPARYGGKGLAIGGLITGGVALVGGIGMLILLIASSAS